MEWLLDLIAPRAEEVEDPPPLIAPKPHVHPRAHVDDDALSLFNAHVVALHEAFASCDILSARRVYDGLHELVRATPPPTAGGSSPTMTPTAAAGAASPRAAACPACGRRVASVSAHLRTCPAAATAAAATVATVETYGDAPPAPVALRDDASRADPRVEMLRDLGTKLVDAAVAAMSTAANAVADGSGSPDVVRELWCAASGLPSCPSSDARPSRILADVVSRHFMRFSAAALEKTVLNARVSTSAMAAAGGGGHPFALVHLGVLQHTLPRRAVMRLDAAKDELVADAALRAALREEAADVGGGEGGASQDSPPPTPSLDGSTTLHGALVSVTACVLGEASAWELALMEEPVPHGDRFAVASALHDACISAALPLLMAYRSCGLLDATLAVARSVSNHAEGRAINIEYSTNSAWHAAALAVVTQWAAAALVAQDAEAVEGGTRAGGSGAAAVAVAAAPSSVLVTQESFEDTSVVSSAVGEAEDGDDHLTSHAPVLLVSFADAMPPPPRGGAGRRAAAAVAAATASAMASPLGTPLSHLPVMPLPHTLPPLPLSLDAAMAICDEGCDQLSFLCTLCERYLRLVTACLGLGSASQPSRTDDALASAMHALQGEYVALERAFLLCALQEATSMPPRAGKVEEVVAPSHPATATGATLHTTGGVSSSPTHHTSPPPLALQHGPGWLASSVHEDGCTLTFACVDSTFFIASKALARALATCCAMAAAAVVNFVAGGLDAPVRVMLHSCIALCQQLTPTAFLEAQRANGEGGGVGGVRASAVSVAGGASSAGSHRGGDGLEDELALQLHAALHGKETLSGAGGNEPASSSDGGPGDVHSGRVLTTAALVPSPPALSSAAITALNTLATASAYARSLYLRTLAEAETIYPPAPQEEAEGCAPKQQHPQQQAASSQSGGGSASFLPLPVARCHAQLAPALETLRLVCDSYVSAPLEAGALAAVDSMAARGLNAMAAALAQGTPSGNYVLTLDHLRSSGGDPLLAAFWGPLLAGSGLDALMSRVAQPRVGAALLRALAGRVVEVLERAWWHCRVNEVGALSMASQLSEIAEALSARMPAAAGGGGVCGDGSGGGGSLRPIFARVSQAIAVLGLERIADLYSLAYPAPRLTRADVAHLLGQRVTTGGGSIAAVQWDRVAVKGEE